jgi:hypothetical protein
LAATFLAAGFFVALLAAAGGHTPAATTLAMLSLVNSARG